MFIKDLNNIEYAVQATTTTDNEVNGNQSISGTIEYTKVNAEFIDTIDRLWTIYDHDDVGYKIIMLNRQGKGNKMYVDFTAIPLFFDYMDTNSIFDDEGIHYRYDGSLTAKNAFDKIFADTPFGYAMVDSATSVEWENFGGGESRLETFKRAIERYHYEFEISGSTVFLKNQAGRDTSIQYRHRFNASDIKQEIDASKQYTAIKGYGNFGERTGGEEEDYRNARLKREYISPLADILGVRWSPPFTDGRVKVTAEMDRKLKAEVDNSLKVSVSANIHNLSKQGYPIDVSRAGDRVFLNDERIGFDEEVRIVSQSITRNWLGDVIDASVTFGSEGLGKRHQSTINTAVKNITDIFEGRKEMPLSYLDKRVQEISNIINGNTDSVFKYTPNGIIGWNGDDANYMTKYVGDAIGFSKDGGATYNTAMSAELGIVADYITTGTLRAIIVDSVEVYGSYIEGTEIVGGKLSSENGDFVFRMNDSRMNFYSSALIRFHTGSNQLYRREGSEAASVSFPTSQGTDIPMMVIGTDASGGIVDANSNSFTGLRVHGVNSPHSTNLVAKGLLYVLDRSNHTNGGFVFRTGFSNDVSRSIYPYDNENNWTYNLGRAGSQWRFSNVFLKNSPDVSSDLSLKTNVNELSEGLEFINALKPKSFNLINDDEEKVNFGVIAQDLYSTLKSTQKDVSRMGIISKGEDGLFGVKYEQFVAPLIKSVQELSDKVSVLESKLN